jgi:benzoyl-CoA reductase/2-hydroxyglutaryl-CoA dehydratase subunit BcrC/BadD/HgdB
VKALETLVSLYEDPGPAIRAWRERGGSVVGYVGADVPRELVAAAGLLPLRLRGDGPPAPQAEEILGAGVDPRARRILAALLDGRPAVEHLLLCHDSDSSVRLFTSLRVLARSEPRLPELWFLDLLHLPTETTARYDLDRLRELLVVLERWSGRPVSEASLREATREANRTRGLLAGIAALRRASPPRLSGTQALAVIGACDVLPAVEANRLLETVIPGCEPELTAPARRVYLTGSGHDSTELYRAIESGGSVIVGEDHDRGEALANGLVAEDGDPLEAIAARYHSGSALGRRHGTNERAVHTAGEAEAAGADVVVAWVRTGDDALAWGLPAQRRLVESRGIRFVALEQRGPGTDEVAELAALLT